MPAYVHESAHADVMASESRIRPKLLVLAPAFPFPPNSGGDIRLFQLLKRLSSDFEIHLAPTVAGDAQGLLAESGIHAVYPPESRSSPAPAQSFDFWRYAPHGLSLAVDPTYGRQLQILVHRVKFQAVLIDHLYMMQYARFLPEVPLFYSATDVETTKFARWHVNHQLSLKRQILHRLQTAAIRRAEGRLGAQCRAVFTTSEHDLRTLAAMNRGGRFIVVSNGVDLDAFAPRTRPSFGGSPKICFVGTMYYRPNHEAAEFLVNKVVPLVRREISDAQCHIAGKTNDQDFSALHRPKDGVTMHGFVDDIRPFFHASQILVVPLFTGSGTRIKILEAMAAGTPVVSSSIGAEGIEYTHGKNVLIADGEEQTSRAIVDLLRDRERCFAVGRAGRQLVEEKYSWDASAAVMRGEMLRAFASRPD